MVSRKCCRLRFIRAVSRASRADADETTQVEVVAKVNGREASTCRIGRATVGVVVERRVWVEVLPRVEEAKRKATSPPMVVSNGIAVCSPIVTCRTYSATRAASSGTIREIAQPTCRPEGAQVISREVDELGTTEGGEVE